MTRNNPRPIKPELIVIGDTIEVHVPPVRGIERVLTGTVDRITAHKDMRYLFTSDGATLLEYLIAKRHLNVFLVSKPQTLESYLFNLAEIGA